MSGLICLRDCLIARWGRLLHAACNVPSMLRNTALSGREAVPVLAADSGEAAEKLEELEDQVAALEETVQELHQQITYLDAEVTLDYVIKVGWVKG